MSLQHVPYRGTAPLLTDLLAGRLDIVNDNLPAYPQLARDGKVKLLAVTSAERWYSVPDVPTVAEAGAARLLRHDLVGRSGAGRHPGADRQAAFGHHPGRLRHHRGAGSAADTASSRRRRAPRISPVTSRPSTSAGARWCAAPGSPWAERQAGWPEAASPKPGRRNNAVPA
ncbi:tripartite tricarboxylate transporter substrate-binding protein [Siccirubricoccus deserti]